MRLKQPDVALIENFLSDAECDAMIALAQNRGYVVPPSSIPAPVHM